MSALSPQSHSRKLAIHGMWVLPLACGVVAFGLARVGNRWEGSKTKVEKMATRDPKPLRCDVEDAFSQAREVNEARHGSRASLEFSEGDGEKMHTYLLSLKTEKSGRPRWDLIQDGHEVAKALGRKEGAAGLQWLSDNLPPLYRSGMDGWAESDPDGAFKTIVSNQRFNPCSPETLTMLLQRHAEAGPEALAVATEQVPWQLFVSDKGEPDALNFKRDSDVRPWMESGVLPYLREQHIGMENFFTAWITQDPGGAIAGWRNWPDEDQRGVDRGLEEILTASSHSEEQANEIDQVIAASDALTLARFVGATKRLIESDPFHDFYEVVEKFPHLHDLTKPPEPPEAEDHDDE